MRNYNALLKEIMETGVGAVKDLISVLVILKRGVKGLFDAAGEVNVRPIELLKDNLDKVADDPLSRTLGDADLLGHVAQPAARIPGDTQQRVRVVGQERPLRHTRSVVPHCHDRKRSRPVSFGTT